MKTAETVLGNLVGLLWGNWVLFVLPGLGMPYTIATGGVQFRSTPWTIKELYPKKEKTEGTRDHKGTVSSIQALCMAIASCMGSGNIVGAAAVLIGGGPGVLSQMWAAASLGMAIKYTEIVLGPAFCQKGADGSYYGGPIYYIEKGLHVRLLGVAVAVLLFFQNTGGTSIQSNTTSDVVFQVLGVPKAVTGISVTAVMIFIIGGGFKRLADVAQKIMPVMASLYITGDIVMVFTNLDSILPMFRSILQDACSVKAGMGAAARLTMKGAMRFGVAGGLYFNEAGERSAAAIHSAAQVGYPARQGFYGVAEAASHTHPRAHET